MRFGNSLKSQLLNPVDKMIYKEAVDQGSWEHLQSTFGQALYVGTAPHNQIRYTRDFLCMLSQKRFMRLSNRLLKSYGTFNKYFKAS